MSQGQEYELASPPTDGVSSMSFSPMPSNLLLVTSWDQTVCLYDVVNNTQKAKFEVRANHSQLTAASAWALADTLPNAHSFAPDLPPRATNPPPTLPTHHTTHHQ